METKISPTHNSSSLVALPERGQDIRRLVVFVQQFAIECDLEWIGLHHIGGGGSASFSERTLLRHVSSPCDEWQWTQPPPSPQHQSHASSSQQHPNGSHLPRLHVPPFTRTAAASGPDSVVPLPQSSQQYIQVSWVEFG